MHCSLFTVFDLGCMQMDATLLTNNSQCCWMLDVAFVCTPCCMLLHVVTQSLKLVKLFSQRLPTFLFFRYRRSVKCNNVGSVCTAPPTLLAPRTLIMHGLHRLMGCILPMMHCGSWHCWELSHPFAHHCQHTCNNSQHCWLNNVGGCCVCLHAALD